MIKILTLFLGRVNIKNSQWFTAELFGEPLRHMQPGSAGSRRDGRVVEGGGLENRCPERDRGFESYSLRQEILTFLNFQLAGSGWPLAGM